MDALVFRNERQREIESLPKSIYIVFSFPFPSFPAKTASTTLPT